MKSEEGGAGNTASDTLIVRAPNAGISLLKQISTSPTGPWNKYYLVDAGTRIYYQFTVENIGDVPLSPISISDDLVNVSACNNAWASFTLPVAVAVNDDHIATCIVGSDEQILAGTGSNKNTAQAIGIYDTVEYNSSDAEATYATNDAKLTLTKEAEQTAYSAVGETLKFKIEAVNTGIIPLTGLTGVTITDDGLGVLDCTPIQPAILASNESLVCTGTHTVDQGDVDAGFYTNTASAGSDQTDPLDASATVLYDSGEDLSFTGVKTFDDGEVPVVQWTMDWINVSNSAALNVMVSDPIPEGSAFSRTGIESGYPFPLLAPFGSTNDGVSCTSTSPLTTTTECYYEGITPLYERGRIIWKGTLGPDFGAGTPDTAKNAITITFNVEINNGVTSVRNIASLSADLNRNGAIDPDGDIYPDETQIAFAEREWKVISPGGLPGDNAESVSPSNLPETGFAPGQITSMRDTTRNIFCGWCNGVGSSPAACSPPDCWRACKRWFLGCKLAMESSWMA